MNSSLKSMLNELRIPPEVQTKLFNAHAITNYQTLKAKQYQLDRRQLSGVAPSAQRIVAAALVYLDSIESEDPIANFTKKGWMTFAVTLGEPTIAQPSTQAGGGEGGNHVTESAKVKISLESEMLDKCQVSEETKNSGEDAMEVDEDEGEDVRVGHRKDVGHFRVPRPHNAKELDDEDEKNQSDDDEFDQLGQGNQGKFNFMPQGFNPGEANLFDIPVESDSSNKEDLDMAYVDWNSRRFWRGKCYLFEDEESSASIIVGIRGFRSKSTASCVRIEHISETFLGHGDNGDFASAVSKHYGSTFVQVKGARSLKVADLGAPSSDPFELPKLIYEPQTTRCRQMLAYVRDNDSNNLVRVQREEIRLIEGFSGAGGMHLGYEEEGFKTLQAIEYNEVAVKTFEHNNAGVPTYCGDIREFLKQMEEDPSFRASLGRIDAIHTSSPCQGFSKANRSGGQNDEANNELAYTFPDLLRLTGALVGSFENVEGMWSRKGMPYLRKVLIDCIELGYQVRVKILRSCDYGDPQKRPRLIIMAAKNFVPMVNHPTRTHGPGKLPYVTPKNLLEPLRRFDKAFPNMEDVGHKIFNEKEHIKLVANDMAPAVLASGTEIWHYAENRPITVRERAALQSFPYNYEFLGTVTQQKRQIGNAVPIELSRAIARSVRETLRYGYVEEFEGAMEAEAESDDDEEEEEVELEENGQEIHPVEPSVESEEELEVAKDDKEEDWEMQNTIADEISVEPRENLQPLEGENASETVGSSHLVEEDDGMVAAASDAFGSNLVEENNGIVAADSAIFGGNLVDEEDGMVAV